MTTEVKRKVRSKEEWADILSNLFEDEETTRKKLASLSSEEDWEEYWNSVLDEDISDEDISQPKASEKKKHRNTRRANRWHKKIIRQENQTTQDLLDDQAERASIRSGKKIKPKKISLYRLVDNGKNASPRRRVPKREMQRVFSSKNI